MRSGSGARRDAYLADLELVRSRSALAGFDAYETWALFGPTADGRGIAPLSDFAERIGASMGADS